MKVYLRYEGQHYIATSAGSHVVVGGLTCCGGAVRAKGRNMCTVDDRRYEAAASTLCCGTPIGVLVVEPATVFGLDEDARVLNGPWRVF